MCLKLDKLIKEVKPILMENEYLSQDYGKLIGLSNTYKEYNLPLELNETQIRDLAVYALHAGTPRNELKGTYSSWISHFKKVPVWNKEDCLYLRKAICQKILEMNPCFEKLDIKKIDQNDLIWGVVSRYLPEDILYFLDCEKSDSKKLKRSSPQRKYGLQWLAHPKTFLRIKKHISLKKLDVKRINYLFTKRDCKKIDYKGIKWLCYRGNSVTDGTRCYEYKNMYFSKYLRGYKGDTHSYNPLLHNVEDRTSTLKEMCSLIDQRLSKLDKKGRDQICPW